MVSRTYRRSTLRLLHTGASRLAVIVALTAISVALVTGLGVLAPRIRDALATMSANGHPSAAKGYLSFVADGIERISYVFPMLFVAVTALVVYMTVTRLVESERAQIGCLKTLGYPTRAAVARYLPFTFVGCVAGGGIGLVLGYFVVSPMLFAIVRDTEDLPDTHPIAPTLGLVTAAALVVVMLGSAVWAAYRTATERPTTLLTGRAPAAGSAVLLAKVRCIWNRIPFRHKSTYRNVFRYKVRFVMTVFSMLLSTALVFCGLSLAFALRETEPELTNSMGPIAALIVLAAIAMSALVIANITNINIEERAREIATLKVLGYRDREVAGYVFREILWLTLIGVIVGLPVGYGAMTLIFDFLRFGGMDHVGWYVWPASAALALTSLGLADLFLFRRLIRTDMNASLRTVE